MQEYIKPELLVLVPLMFGLGAALKADKRFPSANIPYTLAVAGMALAALYGAATAQLDGWQSVGAGRVYGHCAGRAVRAGQRGPAPDV